MLGREEGGCSLRLLFCFLFKGGLKIRGWYLVGSRKERFFEVV